MTNLDEALRDRAQAIGHAYRHAKSGLTKWVYWAGYDWHETLKTEAWTDTKVDYRRPPGGSACLVLDNVQAKGVKNPKESEPVELESKVIDATSIESYNMQCWLDAVAAYLQDNPDGDFDELEEHLQEYWGAVPVSWEYSGEFEQTRNKREAFNWSVESSIRNCFTAGSDASAVKNELELTVTAGVGGENETEAGSRTNRIFTFSGQTPAGVDERITAWRKIVRMRSTITGTGDYEHSVRIGKHWHGRWRGDSQWDTYSDFLRAAKGKAPSNIDLANEFRRHPLPNWLIRKLEAPLDLPYVQSLEFDQATSIQLRKTAL